MLLRLKLVAIVVAAIALPIAVFVLKWAAIAAISIGVAGFFTGCGPTQCKRVPILISSHPTAPKPAGRVTVGCDGRVLVDIEAEKVEY